MGCGASSVGVGVVLKQEPEYVIYNGGPYEEDGALLYKASHLYLPRQVPDGTSVPGMIFMHGLVRETGMVHSPWSSFRHVAKSLARKGIASLMVGMPDNDDIKSSEEVDGIVRTFLPLVNLINAWPCAAYGRSCAAAIEHLRDCADKCAGVKVDKVGLMGHSMGGGGVLYAAAHQCKDTISCVLSLSPSHMAIHKPFDNIAHVKKFATGKLHSGEYGEGDIQYLGNIIAPTFIQGSQAEYNQEVAPGVGYSPNWPYFPSVFLQVGASQKELFVDDMKDRSWIEAHSSLLGTFDKSDSKKQHVAVKVVLDFLERHLLGKDKPPLPRPAVALEWEIVTEISPSS